MATAAEVSAWSREVRRLENQIEYRKRSIDDLKAKIKNLELARDELIEKIIDAGSDE